MAQHRDAVVEISVFDHRTQPLPGAAVTLAPAAQSGRKRVSLKLDRATGLHRAAGVAPGDYRLAASAKGYEAQERDLTVGEGRVRDTVVLGEPGMPFVYRGRVPFPFEPREDLLALSADPSLSAERLDGVLRELKLSLDPVAETAAAQGFRVLRLPKRTSAARREEIVARLRDLQIVARVGPIVALDEERVIFATEELVVRFEPSVTEAEVGEFARRHELEILRSFSYAGNAFLLRAFEVPSYRLLARFARLAAEDGVIYAEPNLVSSGVPDQIVPDDQLYASQWHLPFIGLPDAWQTLRDHNAPGVVAGADGDITFGSQELVIAVMDEGIESRNVMGTTTPHPDFSGTVTGGAAKMFGWIDWVNLTPDNNSPLGSHGTECAGVAAAKADNPSTVAGEDEGVVGPAANCRLLGMIHPSGHPEVDYADAYVWAAGFDPHSARPGFPAPLARGADVTSQSYGWFTGVAISGIMKDCFDHLATYGRGGRGTVCFFSAGNSNTTFNLQRPWAAYERNFGIAASTDGDVRSGYSNFGNGIDLCAPSSGGAQNITTTDRVGLGSLAGHTGGSNDYTSGFGGTSSATPLTAGLAALLISINPTLTCVELRQILQSTAVKIDFANTDPTGQWVDTDADGTADYSQWYGNGRIDAAAAAVAARDFAHDIDLVVRDNLGDTGAVPTGGVFWASPDLWVRNADPATDGAAALPASYSDPPPHQDAVGGSTNWVYARIVNNGTRASLDYYVRFYIAHYPGTEFTYPANFIPTTRPSDPIPNPLVTGTYLIGEVHRTALAPGAVDIVSQAWPAALIPPESVTVGPSTVHWHPCLLLEVAPHDGPSASGAHVWDDNNLAQRNITIVHPDSGGGGDFQAGIVVGGPSEDVHGAALLIDRSSVPPSVPLYVELPGRKPPEGFPATRLITAPPRVGRHRGRRVLWLSPRGRTLVPLDLHEGEMALLVVGAAKARGAKLRGRIDITQMGRDDTSQGGYTIDLGGTE
ncbi:MAG: serine protease [Thermoleophilaceae bacterium]|nr:serine protease [Thermoleophilaceae bacterium]